MEQSLGINGRCWMEKEDVQERNDKKMFKKLETNFLTELQ